MMIFRSITAGTLLLICTSANAWTFKNPDIISNYDGDTITAEIEVWPAHFVRARIRVVGVDSPEIGGAKCPEEKALAIKARAFTAAQLGKEVEIAVIGLDLYGRALAVVTIDGQRLDKLLVAAGLGRENYGQKRAGWCN